MISIIECDVKNLYRNSVNSIYMKATITTKISGFELKSRSIAFHLELCEALMWDVNASKYMNSEMSECIF